MTSKKIGFLSLNLEEAGNLLFFDLYNNQSRSYFFVNSYSISLTTKLSKYEKILIENNRNFVDGKALRALLNLGHFNKTRHKQIRGADFTRYIFENISENTSIFILGGSENNYRALSRIIEVKYPNVKISGFFSPPHQKLWSDYLDEAVGLIAASGANLVFVSLGTPKQDFISYELARKLQLVVVSIGAALDFISLNQRECPKFLQVIGLEWLFRLFSEPRRLWRRYLVDSPRTIKIIFKKDILFEIVSTE